MPQMRLVMGAWKEVPPMLVLARNAVACEHAVPPDV
jgi:hypothetical protein